MIRSHRVVRNSLLCVSIALFAIHAGAQSATKDKATFARVTIPLVQHAPTIEDFTDMEPASPLAKQMLRITNFTARLPVDDVPSSEPTEVYLGYDSANLYSVFLCFDSHPEGMRARRPSRDNIFDDDSVTIQLDTFHDQQRAYSFGVNAGGIQGDAVWTEGQGWDPNFDTVYRSEVKRTSRGYIAFLAVPFRSMRFPTAPEQEWGILLNRYIARTREDTFWPRYTQSIQGRTNQMGTLDGLKEISSGKNFQIVPYTAFVNSKLLEANDGSPTVFKQHDAEFRGGMDMKSVWRDKLTFDLTANPDFSQVEADDPQVLVNQRFAVFFPEKRLFFLENSSYFQTPIQLLFTRTIVKPDAGARVTGKLGDYGVGLLFSDDRATGENLPPADPNSDGRAFTNVARITRDIRPQTYVGVDIVQHKFGDEDNLAVGGDTLIKLPGNWRANSQVVVSRTKDNRFTPAATGEALYGGLFEDSQHWIAHFEYNDRSPSFRADAGFIPRVDYRGVTNLLQYNFRPQNSKLVRWGPVLGTSGTWDYSGQRLDWLVTPEWQFEFKRNTILDGWGEFGGIGLRPVDFSSLTANREYQWRNFGGRISSTPVNSLSFDVSFRSRREVNYSPAAGPPVNVNSMYGTATIGVRPSAGLTIDNTYLFTQLEDEHSNRSVFNDHIMRSRWLYQFDQRWSLRFTVQYSALLVNPGLTSLPKTKQVNGDILLAYRPNPGTAFFVGYNYDAQNYDPHAIGSLPPLARLNHGLINDGRVLFVKLAYLFRY